MNGREADLDDLFERDADSRLLERRRREELGLAAHAPLSSSTPARFGAESLVNETPRPAEPRGAMLRVAAVARPDRELIPGAVVTIVVSLHDDGDADAAGVRLRVGLPPDTEPVPGSFSSDELTIDAEALTGEGMTIETVAAGRELRVRFAVRIMAGIGPLDVTVHAAAPGVPTISAPSLRLTRRLGHAAFDPPRPFYELEQDETDETLRPIFGPPPEPLERAVDTILDEPIAPPSYEPPPEPETQPEPEPIAVAESEPEPVAVAEPEPQPVAVAEPEPEPAPEPEPELEAASEPEPVPVHEYMLVRGLEVDEVRALERVFSGGVPHGLAAMALLSSIAAVDAPLGESLGVRSFAHSVSAALPRALVASKLQRTTPPVVTRQTLAMIRPYGLAPEGFVASEGPHLALHLDARSLDALRAVLERDLDDPFLRGVQVLLAVCPRTLENVAHEAAGRAAEALATYRVAAGAWLMRVTVRRTVDFRYNPLTAPDPLMYDAGKALVAALTACVA